jgi:hypothetical protein
VTLVKPRRFAEVFQVDFFYRGTVEQQLALRGALTPEYGSPHHHVLKRLDHAVNATGDSHLTVGFRHGMVHPGLASFSGFNLSAAMGPDGIYDVARHEFGHLVDFYLLTDADRAWFMVEMFRSSWPGAWESWAEAVREWLDGGWKSLDPILLRD